MAIWVRIVPKVAQVDRPCGLRGWLRLPSVLMVLSALGAPMALLGGWVAPIGMDTPAILLADLDLLLYVGASVAMAVLWFRCWPGFRTGFAWLSVLRLS